MPNLIEWIGDLTDGKRYLMTDENEREYVPFVINNGMSNYMDCILLAQAMNLRPALPIRMQHDFYFYEIRKGRRYGKWAKKIKLEKKEQENIDLICKYYEVSEQRAIEYLDMLSSEQVERIRSFYHANDNTKPKKNTTRKK